jgi:hypothetical protein
MHRTLIFFKIQEDLIFMSTMIKHELINLGMESIVKVSLQPRMCHYT